jgi:hypothetical protein
MTVIVLCADCPGRYPPGAHAASTQGYSARHGIPWNLTFDGV